jgi:hypothetical protein
MQNRRTQPENGLLNRPFRGLLTTAFVGVFALTAVPTMTSTPKPVPIPDSQEFARTEAVADWWLSGAGVRKEFHAVEPVTLSVAVEQAKHGDDYRLFRDRGGRQRLTVPYAAEIASAARRHELDDRLIAAIVQVESSFNAQVVSPRGAIGLMQVMPDLATESMLDPFDPKGNLELGSRYFSRLLRRYDGDLSLALAAYNAGPGAVDRFGGIPPYRETNQFVKRVLAAYDLHQLQGSDAPVAARVGGGTSPQAGG